MKKFVHTLFVNFRYYFLKYFLLIFLFVAAFELISLAIKWKKSNYNGNYYLYIKEKLDKAETIKLSCFAYLLLPIWSTVFSRLNQPKQEPLSNIFGGWGFLELQYFFDFSALWNVVLFLPMALCIFALFKLYKKQIRLVNCGAISIASSFAYSGTIEGLQILLRVGTFQLADLFYNTLGGLLGAIIVMIIIKRRYRD